MKAEFLGYQACLKGSYPIYNILGGKYHGSTVSEGRLKKFGIEIPKTPTEEEYQKNRYEYQIKNLKRRK